jgi:tetratricopeptide (TPR) repeat protein
MVVIVLALLTFQRAMIFRRVESLARDTLKKNERAWTARYYLANAMARRGDFEGALGQYSAVFWGTLEDFSQEELQKLEASTSHQRMSEPRMSFNRGLLAARKNQLEQALRAFNEATSDPQLRAQATIAIAAIEARRGNLERARQIITSLYEVPTTR